MSVPDWGPGWCPPAEAPDLTDRRNLLPECEALAAVMGFKLWGWQRHFFALATELDAEGNYARERCVLEVPRRAGKSVALEVRAALGCQRREPVSITAQNLVISGMIWNNVVDFVLDSNDDWLDGRPKRTIGQQYMKLKGRDAGFRVLADLPRSVRGHTIKTMLVDEGAFINQEWLDAATPTMATVHGAQLIICSSSGDETSLAFEAEIEGARALEDRGLYMRWGAHIDDDHTDPAIWRKAIPTLGQPHGVRESAVAQECRNKSAESFRREWLGISSGRRDGVFDVGDWAACLGDIVYADWCILGVDTNPTSAYSSIVAVWPHDDGQCHAALLAAGTGDDWLVREVLNLTHAHRARMVVVDARSPAASIEPDLARNRVKVVKSYASDTAAAAVGMRRAAKEHQLLAEHHDLMTEAAANCVRRPLADGWAIDRKPHTQTNITPIVALSLALHHARKQPTGIPIGIS